MKKNVPVKGQLEQLAPRGKMAENFVICTQYKSKELNSYISTNVFYSFLGYIFLFLSFFLKKTNNIHNL